MRILRSNAKRILLFLVLLVSSSGLILLVVVFCPFGPVSSSSFDCDDATLVMYNHFRNWGFDVIPVAGNLKLKGETLEESDHIWLVVQIGNNMVIRREWLVPYDWKNYWGEPHFFDDQHHEYYAITYETLLKAVEADK